MNRSLKQFKETRRSGAPPCDDFCKMRGPCTLPDIHQKKKQQNKTPHKLVSNKLLPPLTCSEEKRSTEGGNKADCVPKDPNIHRYQLQDYGSLLIHDQSLSPHWIIPQCNISNKNHTKHDNLLVSSSLVSQRWTWDGRVTHWRPCRRPTRQNTNTSVLPPGSEWGPLVLYVPLQDKT